MLHGPRKVHVRGLYFCVPQRGGHQPPLVLQGLRGHPPRLFGHGPLPWYTGGPHAHVRLEGVAGIAPVGRHRGRREHGLIIVDEPPDQLLQRVSRGLRLLDHSGLHSAGADVVRRLRVLGDPHPGPAHHDPPPVFP